MTNEFQRPEPTEHVSGGLALSEEAIEAAMRQRELEQSIEAKRLANSITVPTSERIVKARLRHLSHPVSFFGENAADRRERLKQLMAKLLASGKTLSFDDEQKPRRAPERPDEPAAHSKVFYSEGHPMLRKLRLDVLKHSMAAARRRVETQKARLSRAARGRKAAEFAAVSAAESRRSEVGDSRPLSCVAVAPSGALLATGSWSGTTKVWSLGGGAAPAAFHAPSRVTDAKFFPGESEGADFRLATCGSDGAIRLWRAGAEKPRAELRCHSARLGKMAFLPLRRGLAVVTSFDRTWSLWDLRAERHVLRQTGHAAEVYAVAVHPDGSLCLTGDLSGVARAWDLRSGQAVLNLRGHAGQVLGADFSGNGVHAATGSGDNSVKLWDLRAKHLLHSIPAHFKAVSDVRFQGGDGNFLLTASFDRSLRVWSGRTFRLLRTLAGHEDKVTGCDVALDGAIFSCSFDRTWKKWC